MSIISSRAQYSLLLDITRLPDSQRLVALGDRGHILYSDNDGQAWQQASVPTTRLLTAVQFISSSKGWAVGHDAQVLVSDDGGQSWRQQYAEPESEVPLLDLLFLNDQVGYAIGAYGTFIRTEDGGTTWQDWREQIANEDEFHFNAIAALDDTNLMIVGEGGLLYRSQDAGLSWSLLASPYSGSLFGLEVVSETEVYIYGLRGNLFKSLDAGDSWTRLASGVTAGLFGSTQTKAGLVVVGDGGVLLTTALAAGATDRVDSEYQRQRSALSAVVPARDGRLIAVGQGGVQYLNEHNLVRSRSAHTLNDPVNSKTESQ